jgi:hypothetical protein
MKQAPRRGVDESEGGILTLAHALFNRRGQAEDALLDRPPRE